MDKTFYLINEFEKDEIILEARKKYVKHSIIRCAVAFAILAVFYAIWGFPYLTELMTMGIWSIFGVMVIFAVAVIIQYNSYMNMLSNWLKKMPNEICMTGDSITIDNHIYLYEDIKQIKATPPEYEWKNSNANKGDRKLIIIDNRNEISKYFLGVMLLKGFFAGNFIAPLMFDKIMFKNYEELCDTLRQVFIDMGNTEKFVWDLENF